MSLNCPSKRSRDGVCRVRAVVTVCARASVSIGGRERGRAGKGIRIHPDLVLSVFKTMIRFPHYVAARQQEREARERERNRLVCAYDGRKPCDRTAVDVSEYCEAHGCPTCDSQKSSQTKCCDDCADRDTNTGFTL